MYNEISARKKPKCCREHRNEKPEAKRKVCALPCTDWSMYLLNLYRRSFSFWGCLTQLENLSYSWNQNLYRFLYYYKHTHFKQWAWNPGLQQHSLKCICQLMEEKHIWCTGFSHSTVNEIGLQMLWLLTSFIKVKPHCPFLGKIWQ